MKFINSKNKFKNLFESSQNNQEELIKKSNKFFSYKNLPEFQKKEIELYNSDWQAYTTVVSSSLQTTYKNDLLPTTLTYDFQSPELDISDAYIPFIDVITEIKTPPQINAVSLAEYKTSGWQAGYYESYGNGSELIYKGFNNKYHNQLYGHLELLDGNFLESHTKKFWEGNIYYSRNGKEYRAWGSLVSIKHHYGSNINDYYVCSPWTGFSFFDKNTYFINTINTNVLAYVYDKGLDSYSSQTLNVLNPKSDIVIQGKIYEKVGTVWNQIGIIETISGDEISSATFSFNYGNFHSINDYSGYLLFWSNINQWIFRILNDEPNNVPDISGLPSLSLPYSYFTWKYNPPPYPKKLESSLQISPSIIQNTTFWKVKLDKYIIRFRSHYKFLQKAIKLASSANYNVYDDTWSQSGNTYEKSIEKHTITNKKRYSAEEIDVEIKTKIIVKNPLYVTKNIKNHGKI